MSKGRPVLTGLNLVVKDMEATIAFYRKLGLDIPDAKVWQTGSGGHHVDLEMPGGVGLDLDSEALASHYNAAFDPATSPRGVIGFSVESREAVDAHYEQMIDAGYAGLQPPYDTFFGARYAIVEDPDGNHVGLMSPIDPDRRTAPPAL